MPKFHQYFITVLLSIMLSACGGSSSGSKESSTQPIIKSYEVSAATSNGGAISPTSQFIQNGQQAALNISPEEGYEIDSVIGCNGSLNRNVYLTDVITAACEVSATFKLKHIQFLV